MMRNTGNRISRRRASGRDRGVALIAVMGVIVLITGVAMSALQITGVGKLAAAADRKIVAQSTCADRATRFLQDQLGDWKLILARVGSSGRCATLYTMNMGAVPGGDVMPPPPEQDPESCYGSDAAICSSGQPCETNPAWQEYMERQAQEQVRFRDEPSIAFGECPETRAIMSMADPVIIGQGYEEVGEEEGKTVGNSGSCFYNIRIFAMHLPQNDMRFYSNYLDKEVIRQIFSSTGCLQ